MSETISQLPAGANSLLGDIAPLTQGSVGPGTGTTRKLTVAQMLSASEILYAGNPAYSGGVVADGVTNDSIAWASAMSAASASGAIVIAPVGVSIASITVPSNVTLIGQNCQSYGTSAAGEQTYTGYNSGQGSTTLGSVIQAPVGTVAVMMSSYANMYDMQVVGASGQNCIDATAGRVTLDDVDASSGLNGVICANAAGGVTIRNCRFHHHSNNGIDSPANSTIANNFFNSLVRAIQLNFGSNNNLVVGNRAVFCSGSAYTVSGTAGNLVSYNTFTGNVSDRASANAFFLSFASMTCITGNGCWRSGRTGATNVADAHISVTGCNGIIITGNSSSVWGDDSPLAIGRNSPTFAIFNGNATSANTNIMVANNVLVFSTGAGGAVVNDTGAPFNTINTTTNVIIQSAGRLT